MMQETIRIPVKATYRIIDGQPVMVSAEWADIPADAVARFLIMKCGAKIPGMEGVEVH